MATSTEQRTFGWVQNPGELWKLQKLVLCLCKDTDEQKWLIEERFPLLLRNDLMTSDDEARFVSQLEAGVYDYKDLKGKGTSSKRSDATCTGIIQAIIDAQKTVDLIGEDGNTVSIKKPYTDDWTAEGYLRWAVITGFIQYDEANDSCVPTVTARALEGQPVDCAVMQEAMLAYPPANRILFLLSDQKPHTKFEMGNKLGFIGERGFSSIEQAMFVATWSEAPQKEKSDIRSNMEGDSDKYARMIAGWLSKLGWVTTTRKMLNEVYLGKAYSMEYTAYQITIQGVNALKRSHSYSSKAGIDKRVMFQMLASRKVTAPDYLRLRRATLLDALGKGDKSIAQLLRRLEDDKIEANDATVKDDIRGLVNVGLEIKAKANGKYHLADTIVGLQIPADIDVLPDDAAEVKNEVSEKIGYIDHQYLVLVDLAYSAAPSRGKKNADAREFEIKTADLLTKELDFKGMRLGDSAKPDVIVSYGRNGIIIDNKSYQDGFSVDKGCADEMGRYIDQNAQRQPGLPPNEWWKNFDNEAENFYFMFITSYLKGNFVSNLNELSRLHGGTMGAAIGVKNFLYAADRLKCAQMQYDEFFGLFDNDEIEVEPAELIGDGLMVAEHRLKDN